MNSRTTTIATKIPHQYLIGEIILFSLPVLITQIYIKYTYLTFGGLEILERALGNSAISSLEYVRLYANDLLETLIIIPLFLLVISALLKNNRILLNFIIIEFLLISSVAAWATYHTIGTLPSIDLISDFYATYKKEPDTVSPFSVLPNRQLIKIALIISLGLIPVIIITLKPARALLHRYSFVIFSISMLFIFSASVLVLSTNKTTIFHAGHFMRIATNLLQITDVQLPDATNLTPAKLKKFYYTNVFPEDYDLSKIHSHNLDFTPTSTHPNVVIIVLETTALKDYDFFKNPSETPNISRLISKSLISNNHHSSYPYSIRANFSLLSSIYDLPSKKMMIDYLIVKKPTKGNSLANILGNDGYVTKYYYPFPLTQGKKEKWMLEYFGFKDIWQGPPLKSHDAAASRINNETSMFQKAISDIDNYSTKSKPFFLTLVSAIGHAPYFDLNSTNNGNNAKKPRQYYIDSLKKFLDNSIGDIINSLEKNDILENTILVITGDHGVRNKIEDQELNLSYSNSRSYNVPILIHYPDAFKSTYEAEWVSSNIDIIPTILSLLQKDTSLYLHQGLPMFNPALKDRATFFWGGHYFGTNAMHSNGKYYMINTITETSCINNNYTFDANTIIDINNNGDLELKAKQMNRILSNQISIQNIWATYLREQ